MRGVVLRVAARREVAVRLLHLLTAEDLREPRGSRRARGHTTLTIDVYGQIFFEWSAVSFFEILNIGWFSFVSVALVHTPKTDPWPAWHH